MEERLSDSHAAQALEGKGSSDNTFSLEGLPFSQGINKNTMFAVAWPVSIVVIPSLIMVMTRYISILITGSDLTFSIGNRGELSLRLNEVKDIQVQTDFDRCHIINETEKQRYRVENSLSPGSATYLIAMVRAAARPVKGVKEG